MTRDDRGQSDGCTANIVALGSGSVILLAIAMAIASTGGGR